MSEMSKLTPPELEIMQALWQSGEMTVTEIMDFVNARNDKQLKRSTIQVQVLRLEEKGWLAHREDGNRFLFCPTVAQEDASAAIVNDLKERVFSGSCVELVKALFSHSEVSSEEIKKLRALINQYKD